MPQTQGTQSLRNGRPDFGMLDQALARVLNIFQERLGDPEAGAFGVIVNCGIKFDLR